MDYRLPFLFFTETFSTFSCGSMPFSPACALPLSNYANKLPQRIFSNDIEVEYAYSGDTSGRITQALITRKSRASGNVLAKLIIRVQY
jgi:hypothetical protein